jgi:hypothetical protein
MVRTFQIFALGLGALAGLGVASAGQAQTVTPVPLLAEAQGEFTAAAGEVIHSEAGRFSLTVPMDFQADTATSTVSGNTLTWTISQATQGENFFAVAYTDLPLEVLAMGQAAVIENLQGRPLVEGFDWGAIANRGQPINQADLPGMEYLNLTEGQVSAVRFYLANRRLYAVMAAAPNLHAVNQLMAAFTLDSLWRPFVSEEGSFTVDLPMAPVFTPQQTTFQGETLDWWQYVGYNLYAPDDRYGFAYADLPVDLSIGDEATFLGNIAALVLAELDAADLVDTGTAISLEGHTGQAYQITHSNGRSYVLRLYLVDRRVYGLLAASKSLNNLDRFLNSFQVQSSQPESP